MKTQTAISRLTYKRACLSRVELKAYSKGEVELAQRWDIESHLHDCPLCSAAVEGASLLPEGYEKALVGLPYRQANVRKPLFYHPYRIAASLVFLLLASAVIYLYLSDSSKIASNDQLAFEKSSAKKNADSPSDTELPITGKKAEAASSGEVVVKEQTLSGKAKVSIEKKEAVAEYKQESVTSTFGAAAPNNNNSIVVGEIVESAALSEAETTRAMDDVVAMSSEIAEEEVAVLDVVVEEKEAIVEETKAKESERTKETIVRDKATTSKRKTKNSEQKMMAAPVAKSFNLGKESYRSKDYKSALEYFNQQPELEENKLAIVLCMLQMGDEKSALSQLKSVKSTEDIVKLIEANDRAGAILLLEKKTGILE